MSVFRIIRSDWCAALLARLQRTPSLTRDFDFPLENPVPFALVGGGRVWAVMELTKVLPLHSGGFLWCFENLREVEGVEAPEYEAPAVFQNGGRCEPQFLSASSSAALVEHLRAEREICEMARGAFGEAVPEIHEQTDARGEFAGYGATLQVAEGVIFGTSTQATPEDALDALSSHFRFEPQKQPRGKSSKLEAAGQGCLF